MRTTLGILGLVYLAVAAGPAHAGGPTYARDVAPILWKNCAGCHRPGEVGPFSLLDFKDAAKRATFLREVTESRQMPPWKAEHGFGEFLDERRLTDAEIRTIADWADAGAPEGDPEDLPEPPRFLEGWQLGTPDLILKVPEPFEVPASGRDIYRCFVIPIPIEADRTVAAVEFRPGNRKVVHHAILYLDRSGAARKKDEAEAGPGYTSFGGPGILPSGGLGGWAPGAMPRTLPDGVGRYLRKGSDLVLQIHYHPDGKAEVDQSVVGIHFTKEPARKIVGGLAVRSRQIDIPPGEKRHHIAAESGPLPVDAQAIGITPHMHYLGREMKAVAETPDGQAIPLVWIKDWDFNWQGQYQYRSPVKLPRGTVIKLDAYYDNSTENLRNPDHLHPRRVHWGEQTTDEMCLLGLQLVTEKPADLLKIVTMRGNGLGSALFGGLGRADDPAAPKAANKAADRLAAEGFAIPERFKDRLGRFDADGDGKLSRDEIDAMPEAARDRLKNALRQRLGLEDDPETP